MTTEECSRYLLNDLCFNCHKKGHLSRNCTTSRDKQTKHKMQCQVSCKVRKVTRQDNYSSEDESEDTGDADTENDDLLCIETIHAGVMAE